MKKRLSSAARLSAPIGALACAVVCALNSVGASAAEPALRLVDSHSHLLRPDADADKSMALFKAAGVAAVVIMDPEPADLRAFAERYRGYVVPFINVSRTPATHGLKFDPDLADRMNALFDANAVCGVGELPTRLMPPTDPTDAATLLNPDRLKVFELAGQRRVPVNMHVDLASAETVNSIETIASKYPRLPLVLAHAGVSASVELIGRLLDVHPNLNIDLSLRLDPLNGWSGSSEPAKAPNPASILRSDGSLQPQWRELIQRHASQVMFAMDISGGGERTARIAELAQIARRALADLSPDARQAVAHGNIEKLLQGCRAGLN